MTSHELEHVVGLVLLGLGAVALVPILALIAAYMIGGKR